MQQSDRVLVIAHGLLEVSATRDKELVESRMFSRHACELAEPSTLLLYRRSLTLTYIDG